MLYKSLSDVGDEINLLVVDKLQHDEEFVVAITTTKRKIPGVETLLLLTDHRIMYFSSGILSANVNTYPIVKIEYVRQGWRLFKPCIVIHIVGNQTDVYTADIRSEVNEFISSMKKIR